MFTSRGAGAPAERERPGGWVVWLVLLVLLVVAAGAYAGARYYVGDRVPRGASISGVDVGGMTRGEAAEELRSAFTERDDTAIEVTVSGDRTEKVTPTSVGMALDVEATLDEAGATDSWRPSRLWDFFGGGEDRDAVVAFDDRALTKRLNQLSEGFGTPPTNGQVKFTGNGKVRTVAPEDGRAIDPDVAREALGTAYLNGEDSAELEVVPLAPEIDAAEVERAAEQVARPAVAAPVRFDFGEATVKLAPRQVGRALRMVPNEGTLELQAKPRRLLQLVEGRVSDGEPVDATVVMQDGQPTVVPAKPGVTFDRKELTATFLDLVGRERGQRTGSVTAKVKEADFTTADAKALGIKEKVSEFTTYYPHSEYRNVNIGQAAEYANGTVLKPGETFSMNDVVGERTAANGFTEGYIIANGILKMDYGGGVSQLATTLFNAMFFAGLEDVEHKPHSFYIDRYPVGREATVAWPTVDLRFRNNTDHGVLVRSYITPSSPGVSGSVTVEMYSTKIWDITASKSERYAYTEPETRYIQDPECEPHNGYSGFQIDVTRTFRRAGESEVVRTQSFHTTYTPSDTVVCGPPPGQRDNNNNDGGGSGDGGNGGN